MMMPGARSGGSWAILLLISSIVGTSISISAAEAQGSSPGDASGQARGPAQYKIPDRVTVNYDGVWYLGSIYAVRDGKYKVLRDDYTSDDRWVSVSELRRAKPVVRGLKAGGALPKSIPARTYTCGTVLSGSSSGTPTGTTIGQIGVLGPGAYTGMVKDGVGPRVAFVYEQATGKIEWGDGRISGFFGKVVESRFSLDNRGNPVIKVTYRVREGGNLFDLSCQ